MEEKRKNRKRADLRLIAGLLILALGMGLWLYLTREQGARAVVYVAGWTILTARTMCSSSKTDRRM